MRALIYAGVALGICLGVFLFGWFVILSTQAMSNRIRKPGASLFVFQSGDPADYNERGQRYLKKAKWVLLLVIAYMVMLFIVIVNVMRFWDGLSQ